MGTTSPTALVEQLAGLVMLVDADEAGLNEIAAVLQQLVEAAGAGELHETAKRTLVNLNDLKGISPKEAHKAASQAVTELQKELAGPSQRKPRQVGRDAETLELVRDFLQESGDGLVLADEVLLSIESAGASTDKVNSLFRVFHTIKGVAGFLELTEVVSLAHVPKMFKYDIVWHKNCPSNPAMAKRQIMRQHELVLIFYKKQCVYNPQMEEYSESSKSRIKYSFNVDKKSEHYDLKEIGSRGEKRYPNSVQKITRQTGIHPTQKPLELMKYLIKTYSNEDDVVMDNCMGSNTTGLACKELNRQYIGIEKEKAYYDISVKRVSECLF